VKISDAWFTFEEVAKNLAMAFPPIRSWRVRRHRTSSLPNLEQLDRYAFGLPDLVLKHTGSVRGKDVLEIGPGDHLATGLTFLALGAKSYTALDRFPGPYSDRNARGWYQMVRDNFPKHFQLSWNGINPDNFPDAYDSVGVLPLSIENLGECRTFDIVCSFAVGEHVLSVPAFATANQRLLRSGGRAVHYLDFGGHMWERDIKDPLMFERIPRWLWSAMGSNRGYPNRVPFEPYMAFLRGAGLDVDIVSTKPFLHSPKIQEAIVVLSTQSAAAARAATAHSGD